MHKEYKLKNINGVVFEKKNEYAFCCIEYFSDELKDIIRKQLADICYGSAKASTGRIMYSYKATVREFLKRYENKTEKIKKGLIGELLTHIIIKEMFEEYRVVSPYFNLEERSIKKGFDIVLASKDTHDLFIIEVKSGGKHKGKKSDETMNDLINLAKNDLVNRLNDENTSLWHNAINGAQSVLEKTDDLKQAVIEILEDMGDKAVTCYTQSKEIKVFLTGVLFADLSDRISKKNILKKKKSIEKNREFNSVFVLSLQKKTYKKIYEFLKEEGK